METIIQDRSVYDNLDNSLWGTSKAFERKAQTIKSELEFHLRKNPKQTSYKWDGSSSGLFGIIYTAPDLKHPNYKTTEGFEILQQTCDTLGYSIEECKITKTKHSEDGCLMYYETDGLEFIPK